MGQPTSRLGKMKRGPKTEEKRDIVTQCRWVTVQGDKVEVRYWPEDPPVRPEGLEGQAAEFWDSRVTMLIEDGIATVADQENLVAMAHLWQRCYELNKVIEKFPVKNIGSPEYKRVFDTWKQAYDRFNKLTEMFGMTPRSRGKILLPSEYELLQARKGRQSAEGTKEDKAETSTDVRKRLTKSKFKVVGGA